MVEDKGVSVTVAGDWSQPATKLIEKVSDALGAAFKPYQIRRVARADADARIEAARAELSIAKLRDNDAIEITELRERTVQRIVAREVKRQINIENTLAIAARRISENATAASDAEEIPDSFIQDVFSYAEDISDERLQELWAEILASSATGKRTSKLTMRILASMDKADAELFQEFSACCGEFAGKMISFTGRKSLARLEERGIAFEKRQHLEALGLIKMQNITNFQFHFTAATDTDCEIQFDGGKIVFPVVAGGHTFEIGECVMNQPGIELLRVVKRRKVLSVRDAIVDDLRSGGLDAVYM